MGKNESTFIRAGKSKRLVAVARPRFDEDGDVLIDGNIGLWPFFSKFSAKRTSKNRPKGTIELMPTTVDRACYERMLIEQVILQYFQNAQEKSRGM